MPVTRKTRRSARRISDAGDAPLEAAKEVISELGATAGSALTVELVEAMQEAESDTGDVFCPDDLPRGRPKTD